MNRNRLLLALERLEPTAWKRFEEFASEFLTGSTEGLRVVAAPGDRGRDAYIRQKSDEPEVLLQFSVSGDWSTKIQDTATVLNKNFPDATTFIYVTNQDIGPAGDDLRNEIRKKRRLFLDIRDRSWFLDRRESTPQTEAAAEQLAIDIVDRYLASKELVSSRITPLTSEEARAAFVFLTLQWEDDSREKGLTKLAFDALVRQALADTSPESRVSRSEVHDRVAHMLPAFDNDRVRILTDAALVRLNKKQTRWYRKSDEFCLSYEERARTTDQLASFAVRDSELKDALRQALQDASKKLELSLPEDSSDLVARAQRILERLLLNRGEAFAQAVSTGRLDASQTEDSHSAITDDLKSYPEAKGAQLGANLFPLVATAVSTALTSEDPEVALHVRNLADVYTLFAFLQHTPDVQATVSKLFSHAEIWLDTSVILPLLVERLLPVERRALTRLLAATRDTDSALFVTPGVLDEVASHISSSIQCIQYGPRWQSDVPFLLAAYIMNGQPVDRFEKWVGEFRGILHPQQDIADYLLKFHGVTVYDLKPLVEQAEKRFADLVASTWRDLHDRRRPGSANVDLLATHDTESYVGVVVRRKGQEAAPFGFRAWWLTFDHYVHEVTHRVTTVLGKSAPTSPALSPDFLVNYLSVGPRRAAVAKDRLSMLPLLMMEASVVGALPKDLLAAAAAARAECQSMPEHVIVREVRDKLEAARLKRGAIAAGGVDALRALPNGAARSDAQQIELLRVPGADARA